MDIVAHREVEPYNSQVNMKVVLQLVQAIVEAMIVGVLVHLEEEV
jgi:hypothetical protein